MGRPTSTIKICSNVLLDNTYQNTIWFDSIEDQKEYFEGKVVKTFSSYSYLRRDWEITVQATMEEALGWQYLFFYNGANQKTYYYFINKVQYENENAVTLQIEMDVMQTYAFDYTLAPSFVEREHQATDEAGDNLLDEGLDLGEYRNSDLQVRMLGDLCLVFLSTINPVETTEETTVHITGGKIGNVFSGLCAYAVHPDQFSQFSGILRSLDTWGKSDGIIAMWMYPLAMIQIPTNENWTDDNICHRVIGCKSFEYNAEFDVNDIAGYSPRNKKLLTYPYQFIYAHNNSGSAASYPFEFFDEGFNFEYVGALSPDASVKMYPTNYKSVTDNTEEGLTLSPFPTCAWNQDVYKLWVAQNQNQNRVAMETANMTVAGGIIAGGISLATGNVMGAGGGLVTAYHGYNQVQGLMAQKKDMKVQPPQSKGGWSASINVATDTQHFFYMRKHIDRYHLEMLDEYFDMYGYKCQRVKVPNRNVRRCYTYTKTVGCNVDGNLCVEDLTKIKSIYDNGITFWKYGDLIGYYTAQRLNTPVEVQNE